MERLVGHCKAAANVTARHLTDSHLEFLKQDNRYLEAMGDLESNLSWDDIQTASEQRGWYAETAHGSSSVGRSKEYLVKRLQASMSLTKNDWPWDAILLEGIVQDAIERHRLIGVEESPINQQVDQ